MSPHTPQAPCPTADLPPEDLPAVTIVMATRNGAAHLAEQLDSFVAQDHDNWALWVSDDGSDDATMPLLEQFRSDQAGRHQVRLLGGPRRGAAANFMSLLCHPELQGHVAISDQDDIWYPDKLRRALRMLQRAEGAAIYSAQSRHITEDGTAIGPSRRHLGQPSFGNALVQNRVSGHSATLNPAALELVQAVGSVDVPFHDWWLYQLLQGAGASVLVEDHEVLDYRQHDNNVLGASRGKLAALSRASKVLGPTFGRWMQDNRVALRRAAPHLTPDTHATLQALDRAPRAGLARARAQAQQGVERDLPIATQLLRLAAILGRI